jgi:hypothetical protein
MLALSVREMVERMVELMAVHSVEYCVVPLVVQSVRIMIDLIMV